MPPTRPYGSLGTIRRDLDRSKERQLIKRAGPDRNKVVRVTFVLPADEPPGAVSVVGDFNGWNPFAHPLRRRGNGTRSAVVSFPASSTIRFRYLAEGGLWFDDETADGCDSVGAFVQL
jgi:1,4-alpha-glucan branching enzyme